ncbi:MAG: hypothetical protein ABI555_07045 [Chloroflexota bacterium]
MRNPQPDAALAELLVSVAAKQPACRSTETGSATTWSIGGMVFAMLDGGVAEFRLDVPIAAAAQRTPDTSASPRGSEWVAFRPGLMDHEAADRVTAWFQAAARRATG